MDARLANTQLERNLGGASANVEHRVKVVAQLEQVGNEDAINVGMIHRIVIAGLVPVKESIPAAERMPHSAAAKAA